MACTYLSKCELAAAACNLQHPLCMIRVFRQGHLFRPDVADLEWEIKFLGIGWKASAAFVCAAPVHGIAYEVVNHVWWVVEDRLGGHAHDTHGIDLWEQ